MRSHSTSDDQSLYQDMTEVDQWKENNCPLLRLRGYMKTRGLWTEVSGYLITIEKVLLYILVGFGW